MSDKKYQSQPIRINVEPWMNDKLKKIPNDYELLHDESYIHWMWNEMSELSMKAMVAKGFIEPIKDIPEAKNLISQIENLDSTIEKIQKAFNVRKDLQYDHHKYLVLLAAIDGNTSKYQFKTFDISNYFDLEKLYEFEDSTLDNLTYNQISQQINFLRKACGREIAGGIIDEFNLNGEAQIKLNNVINSIVMQDEYGPKGTITINNIGTDMGENKFYCLITKQNSDCYNEKNYLFSEGEVEELSNSRQVLRQLDEMCELILSLEEGGQGR